MPSATIATSTDHRQTVRLDPTREEDSVTETTPPPTPVQAPPPPPDYPYPEWTEDAGDDDGYVPPELRSYYAEAEPSPRDEEAYVTHGSHRTEPRTVTERRALGERGDREPVVVTEDRTIMQLVHLTGEAGYWKWRHHWRLDEARRRHRDAVLSRALYAAQTRTCQVCGVRSAGVIADSVWLESVGGFVWSDRYRVNVCDSCAPVLTSAIRAAHADAAASRLLPDGRTVGQRAAEVAGVIVADHNESAETG
jgi:hypothetical protein